MSENPSSDEPESGSIPIIFPKRVPGEGDEAVRFTEEEVDTAYNLSQQLWEHGKRGGAKYDLLEIMTDERGLSFAINKEEDGRVIFCANITTALGCLKNLEGVIWHETGHLHYPTASMRANAELIAQTLNDVFQLKYALEQHPAEVEEIIGEIDSVKLLSLYAREVINVIIPTVKKLEKTELFMTASPESLAIAMENNTPEYQQIKEMLEETPSGGLRRRLLYHIHDICKEISTASSTKAKSPSSTPPEGGGNSVKLASILAPIEEPFPLPFHEFANSLKYAAEYACDSYAQAHSDDPDSVYRWLRWYIEYKAEKQGRPFSEFFYADDEEHPSPAKRINRLEFKKKCGRPPNERELHQLVEGDREQSEGGWQSRIKRGSLRSDQSPP